MPADDPAAPLALPDGDEQTLDRLAGDWWIYQLRRGHRYSTDDILLAWAALRARPDARHALDLGAGVGAVGLITLLRLPQSAVLTSVEVQALSAALLRKTVAYNDLGSRVDVRHGDLRAENTLAGIAGVDLVAANPPYLAPSAALHSPHPQRLAARIELNGNVFDYARAAASVLSAAGRFCLCHSASDPRSEQAVVDSGLVVLRRQDVVFREGQKPTIALLTCGREGEREDAPPMVVRDRSGARTDAFRAVRRDVWIEA